jgi:desampylase
MDVWIASSLHAALIQIADASPAVEVCGLLFGTPTRIDAFQRVLNASETPETAFEIDPQALIAAHKSARSNGPALIGSFHSHPNGVCAPSHTDHAASAGDGAIWLIIAGGKIGAWRAEGTGRLIECALRVEER